MTCGSTLEAKGEAGIATTSLAVRLLGPVELWHGHAAIAAGGPTQRAVLAMLALRAGQPVPVEELAVGIWGESDEPLRADKGIQIHVSRLRSVLRQGSTQPLATVPGGYRLKTDGLRIDTIDFERLLAQGRRQLAANDPSVAATTLGQALALWHGPALMDLCDFPFAIGHTARYEELRADAAEELIAARLALGEAQALLPELHALVAEHPYRERLRGQLMVALYRAGQQAAALAAFADARAQLALDLGVEPGPELQQLQQRIRAQAGELLTGRTSAPSGGRSAAAVSSAHSLPVAPRLFGREDLLARLEALASTERLITLTGAGGSGKTALAVTLLHRLASRFPDGAAFVDLSVVSRSDQVLPAIAAGLGVGEGADALGSVLARHMRDRSVVLLLDNFEHVVDAAADIAPLIEAGAGRVVTTSRSPLHLRGEYVVDVPPLLTPDNPGEEWAKLPAVQMFLECVRMAGAQLPVTRDTIDVIARICRTLDGLPLAIQLVAGEVRAQSPIELAENLLARLPRLRARYRNLPLRQRTIESTVRWSEERLGDADRRAFLLLSAIAGSFDIAAAAATLGTSRSAAIGRLDALLDASLIAREAGATDAARFHMLQPIRAVAGRRLLRMTERKALLRRYSGHFSQRVYALIDESTGVRGPQALRQLREDAANVNAALTHLMELDLTAAVRLAVRLNDFWRWTGQELEGLWWARRLLSKRGLGEHGTAAISAVAAEMSYIVGDASSARRFAQRAKALGHQLSDEAIVAWAACELHDVARRAGDMLAAARSAHEAAQFAQATDSVALVARSLVCRARTEDSEARSATLNEALALARDHKAALQEFYVLLSLGVANRDGVAEDERWTREALGIARGFAAAELAAVAENNLGHCLLRIGDPRRAAPILRHALGVFKRTGQSSAIASAMDGLARIAAREGDWRRALTLAGAVQGIHAGSTQGIDLERDLAAQARAMVGSTRANHLLAAGRVMSRHQALAFALEEGESGVELAAGRG